MKNKDTLKLIMTLSLILAIAFPMFALNNTTYALDLNIKFYPEITAAPNPVGVGQRISIITGFTFATSTAFDKLYSGWTITVTRPDGTTTTLGPFSSDSTGYFFTSYVPDQVGTYKFQAHYPGGIADFVGAPNATVPPADTTVFSVTVQEEPIPNYANPPLPTEYWNYPINAENRAWGTIAGNWYSMGGQSGGRYGISGLAKNYYTPMPKSAHILWAKPDLFGGIIGSGTEKTYYDGSSYRPSMLPPIVISGRLYYNNEVMPKHGWYCVDMATGETIWYNNGTFPDGKGGLVQGANAQLTAGQVLSLDTMNWHGGFAYLWSTKTTTWAMWDAFTGNLYCTFVNAPARPTSAQGVTLYIEPGTGTILTYLLDRGTNTLVLWNSTRCLDRSNNFGPSITRLCFDTVPHYNIDWRLGIQWNITIPLITGGGGNSLTTPGFTVDQTDYSRVILHNHSRANPLLCTGFTEVCVDGKEGRVLWTKTRTVTDGTWEEVSGGDDMSVEQDTYIYLRKETKQVYAYRISTGEQLWVSDVREGLWNTFARGPAIAYDKVIVNSYDGEVWAHDIATGQVLWKWGPVKSGLVTPYGQYPFIGGITIADNKIVVCTNEHSGDSPLYQGERMYVIDLDTGKTVWNMLGWYQIPAVGNGAILAVNQYDGRIYAFGRGSSATSVSAPDVDVTLGQGITIKGTVIDISAGTKQTEQAGRFPNGVPAVSDESQTAWMEYVYSQQVRPANATGVEVTLSVIDANNNYRVIGTTTSNSDGFFSYHWIPDIPGMYTLQATFNGSDSYWGSHATTAFNVAEPQATPAATQIQTGSASETYLLPGIIAIIVAIIVVGIVLLIAIRKRP